MAESGTGSFFGRLGAWLGASRPTVTWIYCSAILFPMAFAFVAALFLTLRHGGGDGPVIHRFFALFYFALLVTLASVPRSILPILLIWLVVARFKPGWEARPAIRYGGLLLLMLLAVSAQSWMNGRGFNLPWLCIGWLSLALPRLAFPMLREGLGGPA